MPPGWMPQIPRYFDNPGFDGRQRLLEAESRCKPFGHWSIWQRHEHRGPRLFSFLFLGGEAIAAYQGLYLRNRITPKVLAIIQPGHAFGNNWTNFYDPNAPLWQTTSAGDELPEYLLIGSYGGARENELIEACPFDGYSFKKRTFTHEDGNIGPESQQMWRTIDIFKRQY